MHGYPGNVFEYKICCDFLLQLSSETFLIPRNFKLDNIIKVYFSSLKVPLLLSGYNQNEIFSTEI